MAKGIRIWLILIFWPFFFYSCISSYEMKTEPADSIPAGKISRNTVLAVQMRSGDIYRFSEKSPATLFNGRIKGKALETKEIPLNQVRTIKKNQKGEIIEFIGTDGSRHMLARGRIENDTLIGYLDEVRRKNVDIPLADIDVITFRKANYSTEGTFVAAMAVIAALCFVIVSMIIATRPHPRSGCCPLIYSFNSENYVLDAEPYGGAICQGMKRTEWLPLDYLRETNGQYRLLASNELDEKEFVDELKLVVVDHPKDVLVLPDGLGGLHTIVQPQAPMKATDKAGRDISSQVAASDGYFWTGRPEGMSPEKPETLKDSLTFEFRKPAGARTFKLIAGAWTTWQGAASAEGILELYGNEIHRYYEDINSRGPAYRDLTAWYANEELYLLKVWIETPDGWKPRGLIYGGGPFIAKEKAYVLDISDVPGETLRLRINPPLEFWMLDRLAVDYTPDLALTPVEVEAASALDQNGKDVRHLLAANDNAYFTMPNKGDSAELFFIAPPRQVGLERTILLKAAGFYDLKLEPKGKPQSDILDRIRYEPGFTLRYAYEWRRQHLNIQARAQRHEN
jgi:hypothetical protein